jgi:hypothetical protein
MVSFVMQKKTGRTKEVGESSSPRRHFGVNCFELNWFKIVAGFLMPSTSLKRVDANRIIHYAHEPFVGGLQWNFRK